jgi:hypothetical protein
MIFSPSSKGFYDPTNRGNYDRSGTWPSDGVTVSDADWRTFIGQPPAGKTLGTLNGTPAWVDVVPPVATKPQKITATQFLNRIPPAVLPVLWGSPQTGIMLITLAAASMIDLTDPAVQGGINALVPSVLTAAQAAAILDH